MNPYQSISTALLIVLIIQTFGFCFVFLLTRSDTFYDRCEQIITHISDIRRRFFPTKLEKQREQLEEQREKQVQFFLKGVERSDKLLREIIQKSAREGRHD